MRRFATGAAIAAMAVATLTGCGQSEYCKAVELHQDTLNTFGQNRTNKAYRKYSGALHAVSKVAPAEIRKQWVVLAEVTDGVLAAHKKVGVKLQDVLVEEKLKQLSEEDRMILNTAYEAFNNTGDERKVVVRNVEAECEIALS